MTEFPGTIYAPPARWFRYVNSLLSAGMFVNQNQRTIRTDVMCRVVAGLHRDVWSPNHVADTREAVHSILRLLDQDMLEAINE